MTSLPDTLADFGPAAFAAVLVAAYLVVGEPFVGHALHRRFEARLQTDAVARRSLYRRLLVLEWGLALLVLAVWLSAPEVAAGQLGLRWPQEVPGVVTGLAVLVVVGLAAFSVLQLRSGALLGAPSDGGGRHAEPSGQSVLALLPRSAAERRLFGVVGLTAGVCEEWLYRGFFLAVVAALAPGLPAGGLVAVAAAAFGLAHAYQGPAGIVLTGVLGGVFAALYLQTGSLLLPVLLHAVVDLRFLLVPATTLPAAGVRPANGAGPAPRTPGGAV